MGKTYRRISTTYHRHPKGHRQALINNVRHKAIPPSSWDDLNSSKEVNLPWRYMDEADTNGKHINEIRKGLKYKFKLKSWEIRYMLNILISNNNRLRKFNFSHTNYKR